MRILTLAATMVLLTTVASAESAFDSGNIAPGQTWSMTFNEVNEGGFSYHCHPHPWMKGMVHVFAAGTFQEGPKTHRIDIVEGADSTDWGYSTEHLSVQVGDTVIWTNTGSVVHTVTEGGDDDGGGHDHGSHDHGDKDSPAIGLLAGLAAVGAALYVRRR